MTIAYYIFYSSKFVLYNLIKNSEELILEDIIMGLFENILKGSSSFGGDNIACHCDGFHSILNQQDGFNADGGIWICIEYGYVNYVNSDNVYESGEDCQKVMGIPRCLSYGGMVRGDAPYATYLFNCLSCSKCLYLEDGKLISYFDIRRNDNGRICSNCGQSLSGGGYTAPWKN